MFLRIHASLNHQSRTLCRISVLLVLTFGASFVHAQSNGLTLNDALQLSLQRSSLTKAANASVLASRESAAKADQLPDPMLKVGIDNLPVTGSDRYSTTSD